MKVAGFDLDETLLEGDSDLLFAHFCGRRGLADASRIDGFYADYRAGCLDLEAFYAYTFEPFRGSTREELGPLLEEFHRTQLAPRLRPAMVARVNDLRRAGWVTVLVTATNTLLAHRVALELRLDGTIATHPARDGGRFTGATTGVPSFLEGKAERLDAWLARRGTSIEGLEDSTYFGDSRSDLPLLERVAHPVAVGPDAVLRARAEERGWEIIEAGTRE